jgi:RNA polymerase sigma-70 factor (ECF subfamily)
MNMDSPTVASDPDAWVDAHAEALFRYALTRLRRREDAEDAVQETLLAALQAKRDFRGDSSERTWLIGILRHKIVDRIRVTSRCEASIDDPDWNDADWWEGNGHWRNMPTAWGGDPQAASDNGEFWQQVRKCFAELPERQAQVFALRNLDERSAEDICQDLGLTPTNLWVLLHRARTRLRECLAGSWFAPERTP